MKKNGMSKRRFFSRINRNEPLIQQARSDLTHRQKQTGLRTLFKKSRLIVLSALLVGVGSNTADYFFEWLFPNNKRDQEGVKIVKKLDVLPNGDEIVVIKRQNTENHHENDTPAHPVLVKESPTIIVIQQNEPLRNVIPFSLLMIPQKTISASLRTSPMPIPPRKPVPKPPTPIIRSQANTPKIQKQRQRSA